MVFVDGYFALQLLIGGDGSGFQAFYLHEVATDCRIGTYLDAELS